MATAKTTGRIVALVVGILLASTACADGELKCVQKPMFWLAGQQTRIVIETPDDCGKLEVTYPEALELFDRWPHKAGDTTQRFYFRAREPLAAGEIAFKAGGYELALPVNVLAWAEVMEPGTFEFEGLKLPRIFPMDGEDEHKSGISFMDQETLDRWRREGTKDPASIEKMVAALPDDREIFYRLPETTVPRAVFVQSRNPKGCPICGRKIFEGRSPFYPWVLDYENHPYQVQCPECSRWFPDNDFGSGDMTSGEYADDGWAYIDDTGDPFCFVSYYTQLYYRARYSPQMRSYAVAYARNGNQRVGRTAALMMFRVAEQYLNLALNINQRKAFMRSAVWTGKIIPQTKVKMYNTWFYIEHNWECPLVPHYGAALDELWEYFETEDAEFLKFLQENYHPEIKTMADARNFIETGYFRVVAQGCIDKTLIGNHPQAQRAAMEAALALNTPRSYDIVEWTFNRDGGMRYFLANEFFIDGSAFESPGYNRGHYINTQSVADVLNRIVELNPERYKEAGFPLLTEDPKYKYMYDFNITYGLLGRTCALVGDSGDVASTEPHKPRPCSTLGRADYVAPYTLYPDDINFARVLWDAEANAPIAHLRDEKLREKVTEIVEREGADIDLKSNFLDGYSHAILRSGKGEDKRTLWVRWGELYGHRHDDLLTIGFEAHKRTLLPELGYPHSWTWRGPWEGNRLTHYSAHIVGEAEKTLRLGGGRLELFADGGWAKMACASARSYKGAAAPQLYEMVPDRLMARTIALVDLDEKNSYAVSVFRLGGGTDHYVSFHGPRGEAVPDGLSLTPQAGGTMAGADIEYGKGQDWTKANPKLSAFPYLYDVQRAAAEDVWRIDWALENYPDVHLRMHEVQPQPSEVGLARGKPPGGGNPYELQWAIQHRSTDVAPLASQFATVIEAYEGEPLITEVRRLEVTAPEAGDQPPVAFEVVCGDRVDTIIQCHDDGVEVTASNGVSMVGSFGIWSETGGRMERALLVNGEYIAKGDARVEAEAPTFTGQIVSADFAEKKVLVQPAPPKPEALIGCHLRITNETGNDCSHLITSAQNTAGGVEFELEYDPRIGEGPVEGIAANVVKCGASLLFGRWLYYHGKTLANEDASALYRTNGVTGNKNVYIDPDTHVEATAERLGEEFVDKDGDGIARLVIYDYGPGDAVTVENLMSVNRAADR